jgi:hypothetical protein
MKHQGHGRSLIECVLDVAIRNATPALKYHELGNLSLRIDVHRFHDREFVG